MNSSSPKRSVGTTLYVILLNELVWEFLIVGGFGCRKIMVVCELAFKCCFHSLLKAWKSQNDFSFSAINLWNMDFFNLFSTSVEIKICFFHFFSDCASTNLRETAMRKVHRLLWRQNYAVNSKMLKQITLKDCISMLRQYGKYLLTTQK